MSIKKTKVAVTALLALPLLFADPSWAFGFGLPWWHIFTAPLVHLNAFHASANLWALWLLWPARRETLTAYGLCCLAGLLLCLWCNPTIGLSGFLFAVIGLRFTPTRRNCLFMAAVLLLGFLPGIAGLYHLTCFLLGLFVRTLKWFAAYAEDYGF